MHVLIISIGPVQEFIASARKCRDLWFGSWLLSELSRAAAKGLVQATGDTEEPVLVFPGAKLGSDELSVANKVVARIEGDPSAIAAAAERAMRDRLREIYERAFMLVGKGVSRRRDYFREETATQQVEGLIELLWAAAPEAEVGYSLARSEAERLLAAAKASKAWEQPAWAAEGVVKSSLDGVRESVLDELLYDYPRVPFDRGVHERVKAYRRKFGVHGAERLCGVGLLKRFGNYEDLRLRDASKGQGGERAYRTFSTTHVASGPFRAGLDVLSAGDRFARYLDELEDITEPFKTKGPWEIDVAPASDPVTGHVDGAVFYEGRLADEIEELGGEKGTVDKAKKALRRFLGSVRELGEPIPYYAIVLADGDFMGKAIDACESHERQRELSKELEGFASQAREMVGKQGGRLIYAGGDDVLGLVPLHTVLTCVEELERGFRDAMKPYELEVNGETRSPTLSVGVAIVHALDPLQDSLALAREAEGQAKLVEGKNGLAILVKPRGGALVKVRGAFQSDGYVQRLRDLIRIHREDLLSAKTQYELMDVAERLYAAKGASGDRVAMLEKIARAETRRLLSRKRAKHGGAKLTKELVEGLEAKGVLHDPGRLGRELYVALHLARAEEQASPERARAQEAAE